LKGNARDGQQYAWVPAGKFMMGCSEGDAECIQAKQPAHSVTITKGFWMARTEVTVGAYKRFVTDTGESMPPDSEWNPRWKNDQWPISLLTWDEAGYFCAWAGGRVPSEAEWEYSARAGNESARYGEAEAVAWFSGNSGLKGPLPVAQKRANAWGIYDMLGNLWEWTTDLFPVTGQDDGPNLPPHPDRPYFAIRGGSWADSARLVRVSARGRAMAGHRSPFIGARCALDDL